MLNGKTIIVTGGGAGIGEAIVRAAHREGANVVIGEISEDSGRAVAGSLGDRAMAVRCDVRDEADQNSLVRAALDSFGRIDGLVNNAGVNFVKPFLDTTLDDWNRVIGTDLQAVFFLTQKVCRVLLEQNPLHGSIVNISSVHALAGLPGAGPYDAAKAGIIGLTRCLAVEFGGQGLRFNAVSPGAVDTQISRDALQQTGDPESALEHWLSNIPLGRQMQASEIADAVVFLLSDRGSAITGTNIVVDAGMTAQLVSRQLER